MAGLGCTGIARARARATAGALRGGWPGVRRHAIRAARLFLGGLDFERGANEKQPSFLGELRGCYWVGSLDFRTKPRKS